MFDNVTFSLDQLFANELQFVAFVTGFFSVFLLIFTRYPKIQYLAWPAGLVSAIAYLSIFYDWQLYGSTILQPWFILVCLAGTWVWRGQLFNRVFTSNRILSHLAGADVLYTTHATKALFLKVVSIAAIATVPVYFMLVYFSDSAPTWDGLILTFSAAAIYLQLKKVVETWPLWILVDLVAIPLYLSQGSGLTGLLYLSFLVQCFIGWRTWNRQAHDDRIKTGAAA